MSTLRERVCAMRQAAFFSTDMNPRVQAGTLYIGAAETGQACNAIVTIRTEQRGRVGHASLNTTSKEATIIVSTADMPTIDESAAGVLGRFVDAAGDEWMLVGVAYRDDAVVRLKARQTQGVSVGRVFMGTGA